MATIRMTGMVSGMDTEALVEAMVSTYVARKEKYQKKQQLIEWKQEAYSDINSKIYSLYTSISNLRFSTAYNLKTASISDSTKATVSAATNAVNGSYSLQIDQLATSGYLTGGKLESGTTSSTTLAELGYEGGETTLTLSTSSGTTDITVSGDTTISSLISSLKSAGVNPSFDETNLRIYVSSPDTGADNDFALVANDLNGLYALSAAGLCTESSATTAAYQSMIETYSVYTAVYDDDGNVVSYDIDEGDTLTQVENILKDLATAYEDKASATTEKSEVQATVNYTDAVNTIYDYFDEEQIEAIIASGNYTGTDEEIMEQIYADIDLLLQLSQETQDKYHYYVETDSGYTVKYIKSITADNAGDATTLVSDKISELMTKLQLGSDNQVETDDDTTEVEEVVATAEDADEAEETTAAEETADAEEETVRAAASQTSSEILSALTSAYKTVLKYSSVEDASGTTTDYSSITSMSSNTSYYLSSDNDIVVTDEDGNAVLDDDGNEVTTSAYQQAQDKLTELAATIKSANATISEYSYFDTGDYTGLTSDDITSMAKEIVSKLLFAQDMYNGDVDTDDLINDTAVRVDAQDSVIRLNGAEYTSSSNSYSINGLTISCTAVTNGDAVQITVATDTQGLYDQIKDFLTQYNEIINELCSLYNADSSSGYEPLTDDEKAEMTDAEIEKWEAKIKDSILRHDSTISSIIDTMVNSMNTAYTVNGQTLSLASFGISTLGYLNAGTNEYYAYHIDGDSEDSSTSGNTDKLLAMITSDPEVVEEFFKSLVSGLYSALGNKMSTSSVSSAFTIYNDKQLSKEYSEYTDLIEEWEEKIANYEDRYYSQFSAMETALSKLQAQSSALSSLLSS